MVKYIRKKIGLMLFFCLGVFFYLTANFVKTSAAITTKDDFQIADGILTAYTGKDTMVTVPDGVTALGHSSFKNSQVVKVVLPSSITKIGSSAFENCKKLKQIELSESITEIGKSAFENCKNLENITLPQKISKIGIGAFMDSGLTSVTLPSSLTKISGALFQNCRKLKKIQMPENLESIGGMAFRECCALEKVTIPKKVVSIGLEAFAYCYKLKKIVIYSDKITKVRRNPFFFHAPDRKVIFKKKVSEKLKKKLNYQDYITKGAVLYHKTSASTVDMCAVKYTKKGTLSVPEKVGKYTVTGVKGADGISSIVIGSLHKGITRIVLADTIERLEHDVFYSACFTDIKFPKNLKYIGDTVLYNVHLDKIKLPNKLKSIGYNAFQYSFYVSDEHTIPNGVDKLQKSILIPKSVKAIDIGNFGYYEITFPDLDEGDFSSRNIKIDGYTVKGYKGSYAQKYAKIHGLKFVAVDS